MEYIIIIIIIIVIIIIAYICLDFNGISTQLLLKSEHGWVIITHRTLWYVITYPCSDFT